MNEKKRKTSIKGDNITKLNSESLIRMISLVGIVDIVVIKLRKYE